MAAKSTAAAKKIVAPDMRQALQKVREQLGPDAVILSNRKVQGGVEITASVDYQAVLDAHRQKERERKHVPEFVDESAEMIPEPGSDKDVIKRNLIAAKEHAARRQLRDQFSQQRANQDFSHAGLVENLSTYQQAPSLQQTATQNKAPGTSQKPRQRQPQQEEMPQFIEENVGHDERYRADFVENYDRYNSTRAVSGEYDPTFDEPGYRQREMNEIDPFSDPVADLQNQVETRLDETSSQEDIKSVKQELNQLRSLLSSQLNSMSWGDYSYRHPLAAAVFKRLRKIGLSAPLCRSLLNQVDETLPKKQAWLRVLTDLSNRLPISADPIIDKSGVVAFVGPAGVGKTTTIAKLAAEYALRHGPESLALITTDSYRIAGHEQLRTLAQILKVPLRIANEQNPLDVVVKSLSRKQMIFIDTAGLSCKDESFDHQMKLLEKSSIPMNTWLVLSSTSQRRILEKTVNEYKHLNLSGSILTKLDESASLGEALSVIVESRLPMSYVTNGQNIPDDIQRPKANQLINLAVSLSKEADDEESEIADMFAEVMVG